MTKVQTIYFSMLMQVVGTVTLTCLLQTRWRCTAATRDVKRNLAAELQQASRTKRDPNTCIMANRGYDVVVDVDQEVWDYPLPVFRAWGCCKKG